MRLEQEFTSCVRMGQSKSRPKFNSVSVAKFENCCLQTPSIQFEWTWAILLRRVGKQFILYTCKAGKDIPQKTCSCNFSGRWFYKLLTQGEMNINACLTFQILIFFFFLLKNIYNFDTFNNVTCRCQEFKCWLNASAIARVNILYQTVRLRYNVVKCNFSSSMTSNKHAKLNVFRFIFEHLTPRNFMNSDGII